jgi:hypothetical protein
MRWLDQVAEDLKKMEVKNWREKWKDRRVVAPTEEEETCPRDPFLLEFPPCLAWD